MKKLGKLFAAMLVLGIAFASCSSDNEYYENPGNPVNPIEQVPVNPIQPPSPPVGIPPGN